MDNFYFIDKTSGQVYSSIGETGLLSLSFTKLGEALLCNTLGNPLRNVVLQKRTFKLTDISIYREEGEK